MTAAELPPWSDPYSQDIRTAEMAVTRLFRPEHVNIESLGNTVPHLHTVIFPRYPSDPRWGRPVWTTLRDEIAPTLISDPECDALASDLRDAIEDVLRSQEI